MKKAIVIQKDYFQLADNQRNTAEQLNELATIYTQSTIKHLLTKVYTPYIDDLRRTYGQNKQAEKLPALWAEVDELTAERDELQEELYYIEQALEDISTPTAEREQLDREREETQKRIDQLTDNLATLKATATKGTTYSDLKDLNQELTLHYITAEPTAKDYSDTLNKVLGLSREPLDPSKDYRTTPNDTSDQDPNPPTAHQLENRQAWEHMNGRAKRKSLRHIARIKAGQRAVNKYIRAQASGTVNHDRKTISLETALENGERIKALTRNTYAESLADLERIKELAKLANLNRTQSRFLNLYCSKGARHAEQQARTQYHAENHDKAKAHGDHKRFEERLNNAGYKARRAWAFNEMGITKANRQADIMKQLETKLQPAYRQLLDDIAEQEPKTPTLEQTKPNPRKHRPAPAHKSNGTIVILPAPHRAPQAVAWITRAEHLEKLEQLEHDKANRWSIADPTEEQAQQSARAYTERHKNDPQRTAETISGLSDTDRAKHSARMKERQALLEKMERWENRHSK